MSIHDFDLLLMQNLFWNIVSGMYLLSSSRLIVVYCLIGYTVLMVGIVALYAYRHGYLLYVCLLYAVNTVGIVYLHRPFNFFHHHGWLLYAMLVSLIFVWVYIAPAHIRHNMKLKHVGISNLWIIEFGVCIVIFAEYNNYCCVK